MTPEITLTDAERQMILAQRQQAERRRWIVEGMFLAVSHLSDLGDQCCGGDGRKVNPETGKEWGEPYFTLAEILSRRACYLSANPSEINV